MDTCVATNSSPIEEPDDFINLAIRTLEFLKTQEDLSPKNEGVNDHLNAFVGAVLNIGKNDESAAILESSAIRNMRPELLQELSQAEYEMELHFGNIFAGNGAITQDDLNNFWYRQCYIDLVSEEVSAMRQIGIKPDKNSRIVFIGSGPLPMTAIDMHIQTGAKIICIDNDDQAVNISSKMVENLGLSDAIEIHKSEGDKFDYAGNDIIFIASLVSQKDNVIARIRTTAPKAYVGVRSVEGIKAMLYEPVEDTEFLTQGLTCIGKSLDDHETTFNTTLFFSPRELSTGSCIQCVSPCANRKFSITG